MSFARTAASDSACAAHFPGTRSCCSRSVFLKIFETVTDVFQSGFSFLKNRYSDYQMSLKRIAESSQMAIKIINIRLKEESCTLTSCERGTKRGWLCWAFWMSAWSDSMRSKAAAMLA